LFALALLCAVLSGCSDGGLAFDGGPEEAEVSVVQTTDGDTVKIAPEVQGEDRVRLIGVDTPETNPERGPKPYGEEAILFTRESIQDRDVTLEFDAGREDDYGRLLAYVRLPDGTMFNETLLREGWATHRSPPFRRIRATWAASRRRKVRPAKPGGDSGVCRRGSFAGCATGGTASVAGADKGDAFLLLSTVRKVG
jgi:micrococcal nuclease